ncbi:hypothetical protein GCM10008018_37950 [Paenibacillus marchantiophytorum]|uniref:Uncharacterized protein n=1 Tax=Paenibacillus marchantiophytorum TaxID=1619310 RepID=A0ABQ1EUM0_9BACL|nr:hypothetical protein GCM10008018_37950 [Paenibacillus marchantiophytorum]
MRGSVRSLIKIRLRTNENICSCPVCDPMDIRVVPQVRAVHNKLPFVFFYDRYPGGAR